MIIRPAIFDRDILALDIAGFIQALTERGREGHIARSCRAVEKPDHRYRWLLRARRDRPRSRRAADEAEELASPHSITSSAMASSVAGTSRPSVFAVLRLMLNPIFVACMTGRSAGFSPLRMRPV